MVPRITRAVITNDLMRCRIVAVQFGPLQAPLLFKGNSGRSLDQLVDFALIRLVDQGLFQKARVNFSELRR